VRYHDGCFAECLKYDTRQRIYIIFFPKLFAECRLSAKNFLFFFKKVSLPSVCSDTRQSLPLCRVPWPDTRQRAQLYRVSLPLHSAKLGNLVFSCCFCQLCRVQWALHSTKRPLPSVTLGKASIIAYFFLFLHSNTSITHSNRKFHRYSSHSSNPWHSSHIHHLHITNTI